MKVVRLFLLLLSFHSFSLYAETNCDTVEQTTPAQCEVLKAIWNQTNGLDWNIPLESHWLQGQNPCDWEGVVCWGANVAKLNLRGKNLSGVFPSLKNLKSLRVLDIANNQLSGKAPDVSFNKKLEQLYLSNNHFSGLLTDFTQNIKLIKVEINNNQNLIGPLVFNGNDSSSVPQFSNTNLCRSSIIDYKHWQQAVLALPSCGGQTMLTSEILSEWEVIADDGKDDSHGISQLISLLNYERGHNDYELVFQLGAGVYQFDQQLSLENIQNLSLSGTASFHMIDDATLEYLDTNQYTVFQKSDKFPLYWDKRTGAMIAIFGSKNIDIKNIAFYGKTAAAYQLNNKDHGISNINSCGTQLSHNAFVDFGGGAVSDYSVNQDMMAFHCNGPTTGTQLTHNTFNNVCEVSTKSSWYGSYGLVIDNNQFQTLKCGLQLYSAKVIDLTDGYYTAQTYYQENLRVTNNTVTGPGTDFWGYSNAIEVTGYSLVLIENNQVIDGPDYAIAVRSHVDGFTDELYDWSDITIKNNQIDNYRQAIYISNEPRGDGFQSIASRVNVENNNVLNSWNSDQKAHIHLLGQGFSESVVADNQTYGGPFGIWVADPYGVLLFGNQHESE